MSKCGCEKKQMRVFLFKHDGQQLYCYFGRRADALEFVDDKLFDKGIMVWGENQAIFETVAQLKELAALFEGEENEKIDEP